MHTALRKMGNSVGMILPKAILQEIGVGSGTAMDVRIEDGRVVATPVRKVRDGWAEDAERIAESGITEEEAEWMRVANDSDDELNW